MNNFIYKIVVQYRGNVEIIIISLASLPLSPCNKSFTLPSVSKFLYSSQVLSLAPQKFVGLLSVHHHPHFSECMVT